MEKSVLLTWALGLTVSFLSVSCLFGCSKRKSSISMPDEYMQTMANPVVSSTEQDSQPADNVYDEPGNIVYVPVADDSLQHLLSLFPMKSDLQKGLEQMDKGVLPSDYRDLMAVMLEEAISIEDDEENMGNRQTAVQMYAEKAARVSDDLFRLGALPSTDRNVGLVFFTAHTQPMVSAILYRCGKGYGSLSLDHVGPLYVYNRFNKLTEGGHIYYLLNVDEPSGYYPPILVLYNGDKTCICELGGGDAWKEFSDGYVKGVHLDFNPTKRVWSICSKSNGVFKAIPGKKQVRLVLDGSKAYFSLL